MPSPSADKPAPKGQRPLLVERLYDAVGLKPQWTGLLLVAGLVAGSVAIEIVAGRMGVIVQAITTGDESYLQTRGPDPFGFVYLVFHFVLLGYMPTAVVLITRAARRFAHGLEHLIDEGSAAREKLARVGTYGRLPVVLSGIAVMAIASIIPVLDAAVWRDHLFNPYNPADMTPEVVAQRIAALGFGYFLGQLLYCASLEAWRFNRLAAMVQTDRLFARETLYPFTRLGLTNVLIISVFPAILLVFLFNATLVPIILGVCAISFVFALAGLFGPLLGIHDRVVAAKREQLDWVNGELASERARLKTGDGNRFTSLMSYRAYVESVREWPLDGSTLGRLALYLAIPLLSWVGAAMVERMVDQFLG